MYQALPGSFSYVLLQFINVVAMLAKYDFDSLHLLLGLDSSGEVLQANISQKSNLFNLPSTERVASPVHLFIGGKISHILAILSHQKAFLQKLNFIEH